MKTLSLTPTPYNKRHFWVISGGRQHKSGKGQIHWVSGSETQNQSGLMEVHVKIYFNYFIVIFAEFKQTAVFVEVKH